MNRWEGAEVGTNDPFSVFKIFKHQRELMKNTKLIVETGMGSLFNAGERDTQKERSQ